MADAAGSSGPKPLSSASPEVIALIRSIGQTITNATLYSTRHPVTASAIEQAYEQFVPLVDARGRLTLALAEDHLTVDGELVETNSHLTATFADRMRSMGFAGFTVEKSTTPDEFVRLVLFFALGATPDGAKGPAALSPENGFEHVKATVVRYEQVLEGQAVVDGDAASQAQAFSGVVVEQIMAFLKGDIDKDGEAALRSPEAVANNAQALGEMILKSAVIRQQAPDLSQGESLGGLVVGCLRRTFSSLSADPTARTQKGAKTLSRSLVMLEKEVLDTLRAMGGDEAGQAVEDVQEAVREMQDEVMIDALAEQYAKRVEAVRGNETRILRYIKRKGLDAATESGLKDRLLKNGLSDEGWNELVVKSGVASLPDNAGTNAVGAGAGSGGAGSGGDTGLMLAALLKQLTELASAPTGSAPAQAADVVTGLSDGVKTMIAQAEGKIDNLAKAIRKRKTPSAKSSDTGDAATLAWVIAAIAEICQELRQPLSVINCTMDILADGKVGPLDTLQSETLRMALDCGERLAKLINKLESISGHPAGLTPDRTLLNHLGQ